MVKVDIPFLLSKSVKKAETVLDMDKAVMFKFTSSGHYCVDIRDLDHTRRQLNDDMILALTVTENMLPGEKHEVLLKLHKQFELASAVCLLSHDQNSGNKNKDCFAISPQIVHKCSIF